MVPGVYSKTGIIFLFFLIIWFGDNHGKEEEKKKNRVLRYKLSGDVLGEGAGPKQVYRLAWKCGLWNNWGFMIGRLLSIKYCFMMKFS